MPQNQDTRVFNGVMDQDSAPFTIDSANVRYRLNLVNLYNDNGFASNENIQGFEMVSNSYLSTSRNKCIGAFEDVRGNSIIYFVWAEDKTHGIYRWYQNKGGLNGQLEKVYQGSVLGFEEYHRISHCSLVDELLIYTDGYGSPKSLNIERMNQTNKRKSFDIYWAKFGSPASATYTMNVYGSSAVSLIWTSAATDYVTWTADFVAAFNSALYLTDYVTIENKGSYATVTFTSPGDYMIDVTPNVLTVANNFYPDVTPTPVSYNPMSEELITAVKYPPFRAPRCQYNSTGALGGFRISYFSSGVTNLTLLTNITVGIADDSTLPNYDTNNYVTLGANNQSVGTIIKVPTPLAYISNPYSFDINIQLLFDIDLNITGVALGTPTVHIFFGRFDGTAVPLSPSVRLDNNNISVGTYNIRKSINVVIPAGVDQYVLYTNTIGAEYTMSAQVTGNVSYVGLNNKINKNFYQFRARYVYKDNQESVLGAISAIPMYDTLSQDYIDIDFGDERLSRPEFVCDIAEVVLSVSSDNGTTWYDFKRLKPFEFIGSGMHTTFNGSESLLVVDPAKAILPYHDIPLTARSQEFADDRIFYGATLTGYNPITTDMSIDVSYLASDDPFILNLASSPDQSSAALWKRGYEGYIGIVYYDDADRRTAVILDPSIGKIKIPFYTESTVPSLDPATLTATINHEPPAWAAKYQFVRTKDLFQSNYLTWVTNQVEYVDADGNPTVLASAVYLKISFSNIPYYTDKSNVGTKINFPYVDGDRIRFIIKSGTTSTFYNFNDHEIVKVDGTDVYIKNDLSISTNVAAATTGGDLVEIYSPSAESNDNLFYEFSNMYAVKEATFAGIKRKYHEGGVQSQSYGSFGQPNTPAIILINNGNVFYRTRIMPYRVAVGGGTQADANFLLSANTVSDYINTITSNDGRVNTTNLEGQTYKPTRVVFSNRYISGTKINGLNAVEAANTRQYSTIYGDLNKMQVVNNDVLKFIFGNGYQLSIYVNQGVIRQSGGASNLISIYDDVAGNSHLIQRTLGTQNAESVVLNDEGDVFGWDETEGVDWLSASNATLQVSDYKMKNTFGSYGLQRRKLDTHKSNAPAVYDLYRDLMILTLAPLQAREEVKPKVNIKLPFLFSPIVSDLTILIQPQGQSKTYNLAPSLNWYYIFLDALPPIFGVTQESDGSVTITAPDYTNYVNSSIVVYTFNPVSGEKNVMTFPFQGGQEASNEPEFSGVTLAYSRKLKGWVTYFSFLPEMYGRLRNQVASFKDGQLWLHDKSDVANNFYGTNYPSELRFVLNKDYPKVKSPLSVWYRGLGKWGAIVRYAPNNMETEMIPSSFRLQENGYSASVTRDRNDPGFTDPQQAWVNGQEIRGDAVEIELYNNDLSQARIDSQKSVYLYSELS